MKTKCVNCQKTALLFKSHGNYCAVLCNNCRCMSVYRFITFGWPWKAMSHRIYSKLSDDELLGIFEKEVTDNIERVYSTRIDCKPAPSLRAA